MRELTALLPGPCVCRHPAPQADKDRPAHSIHLYDRDLCAKVSLGHPVVLLFSLLKPTADLRARTVNSSGSRNVTCRQVDSRQRVPCLDRGGGQVPFWGCLYLGRPSTVSHPAGD